MDVMLAGDEHLLTDGRHEVRYQVVLVTEVQLEQEIVVPERTGHCKDKRVSFFMSSWLIPGNFLTKKVHDVSVLKI